MAEWRPMQLELSVAQQQMLLDALVSYEGEQLTPTEQGSLRDLTLLVARCARVVVEPSAAGQ